jgi:uncharacterized protein YyaL (SSP411 family)
MAETTLRAIAAGGIYDQLGFGLHRYATDREWLLPHYEKMLYDQALFVMACVEAFLITHDQLYRRKAEETILYAARQLTLPGKAFYSSEDADSEGGEGAFYLWTWDEIRRELGEKEAALAARLFSLREEGNYIDPVSGTRNGRNILHRGAGQEDRHDALRRKLLKARSRRARPRKDTQIITSWNGLMIAALAEASRAFACEDYAAMARNAIDFILDGTRPRGGALAHVYSGQAWSVDAFLDDYAFFVWGLLESYEATFRLRYLEKAVELTAYSLQHFWDGKNGGFFFTADTAERMLVRRKEFADSDLPSGNSVALLNLLRLGHITGDAEYEDRARRLAQAAAGMLKQSPSSLTHLLQGLLFLRGPAQEIVVTGEREHPETKKMLAAIAGEYLPYHVLLFKPRASQDREKLAEIARFTEHYGTLNGRPTAYVCRNYSCQAPLTDHRRLAEVLARE